MIGLFIFCLMWLGGDTCKEPLDLLFLIDGSSGVPSSDFMQQKSFISSQPMEYLVSPNGVRIGAIVYSDIAWEKVDFKVSENEIEFISHISRVTQPNGERVINSALRAAHELFLNDARPDSKRIVVLITAGRSRTLWESFRQAREMRKDHISVYAIGVGNKISHSELMGITSDRESVLSADTFQDLFSLSAKLHELICPGFLFEPSSETRAAYNTHHQIIPQDSSLFKAEVELSIITNSKNKGESPLLPQRIHLIDNYSVETYTTTPVSITMTTRSSTKKPNVLSWRYKSKGESKDVQENKKTRTKLPFHSALNDQRQTFTSEKLNIKQYRPSSQSNHRTISFGFVDETITDLKQISAFIDNAISKPARKNHLANDKSKFNDRKENIDRFKRKKKEDNKRTNRRDFKSQSSVDVSNTKKRILYDGKTNNPRGPPSIQNTVKSMIKHSAEKNLPSAKPSPISIPAFEQPLILINEKSIWDTLIGDIQPIIKYKYQKPSKSEHNKTKAISKNGNAKDRRDGKENFPKIQQMPPHIKSTDNVEDVQRKTHKVSDDTPGILFKAHPVKFKQTSVANNIESKGEMDKKGVLFKANTVHGVRFSDPTPTKTSGNDRYTSTISIQKKSAQNASLNKKMTISKKQLNLHKSLKVKHYNENKDSSPATTTSFAALAPKPNPTVPVFLQQKKKVAANLKNARRNVLNLRDQSFQKEISKPIPNKTSVQNTNKITRKDRTKQTSKPSRKLPDSALSRKGRPINTGSLSLTKDLKQEVAMLLEILMLEHDRMIKGKKKKKQKKTKKKLKTDTKIPSTTPTTLWKSVKRENKIKLPSKDKLLSPQRIRNSLKPRNGEEQNSWNFRRPASFRPGSEIKRQYLSQKDKQTTDEESKPDNDNCQLKPYDKDSSFYIEKTENRTVLRPCPGGTAFDIRSCACTIMTVTRSISDCEPEILLDFNNNMKDKSGKNIHVGADHIEIHNGSALFLENGDITIWRFTGSHIGRQLMIQARFKATKDPETRQYVISNCNYGTDISYGIEIDRVDEVVIFTLDTEPRDQKEIKIPFELDKWTSVSLIYDGLRFSCEVNGKKKSMPLAGNVETRSSPLRIGGCGVKQNRFSGYIDEVSMSFCIPKKRKGLLSG